MISVSPGRMVTFWLMSPSLIRSEKPHRHLGLRGAAPAEDEGSVTRRELGQSLVAIITSSTVIFSLKGMASGSTAWPITRICLSAGP